MAKTTMDDRTQLFIDARRAAQAELTKATALTASNREAWIKAQSAETEAKAAFDRAAAKERKALDGETVLTEAEETAQAEETAAKKRAAAKEAQRIAHEQELEAVGAEQSAEAARLRKVREGK